MKKFCFVFILTLWSFLLADNFEVSKNKLKLSGLEVDTKAKEVYLDAKICMSSGILEYLMCLPQSFEHESIFVSKVRPELLHTGLLLVRAQPLPYEGRKAAIKKLKENPARLKIDVEWKEKDKIVRVPLHKLLISRLHDEKTFAKNKWFFVGSYFTKNNVYAANEHLSVISILQHPASVIYYGESTADPHRSGRGGFEVNDELCPPMDTKVRLIFSVHP